jgi:hypothetical protein
MYSHAFITGVDIRDYFIRSMWCNVFSSQSTTNVWSGGNLQQFGTGRVIDMTKSPLPERFKDKKLRRIGIFDPNIHDPTPPNDFPTRSGLILTGITVELAAEEQ